ncbi:MAG: hypothetical protein AB7S26_04390 [Sandaracinaceae bacterium]
MTERLRLGDMLVAAGVIDEAQVAEALEHQRANGLRLGEALVALGHLGEAEMTQMLSSQLSIPWVDLYHVEFSRELLDLVPAELAQSAGLIPIYIRTVRRQGDTLFVAMTDPLDEDALQQVADASGLPVKPMVANPSDVRGAIRVYYLGLPSEEVVLDAVDVDVDGLVSERPPARPSGAPRPNSSHPPIAGSAPASASFVTLTLLDGTTVKLPRGTAKIPSETPRGLTTRDLIAALNARAAGEDVSDVLEDGRWEPLFAALLSLLLKKGLIADWEFVEEWKRQRERPQ